MATSVTTTYAGQFAGEYIADALFSASTLDAGAITIKPNIAFKEVVKKADLNGVIADATCDFTDAGNLTLTERILEPKRLQVNHKLCKADFASDWEAVEMGFSQFKNMPPKLSDWLIGRYSAIVADATETSIWQGSAGAGDFDGFVTLATADANVLDVASPASGGIDSSNVITELGKVVDTIPSKIYRKPDLTMYVAQNVMRAYIRALGGFGASGLGANGFDGKGNNQVISEPLYFDGVKIFCAEGLADSYVMVAQASNLWFGTGLLSDHNEIRLIDTSETLGDDNVRFVMRYSAGVQYGIGSEVVLYTPA